MPCPSDTMGSHVTLLGTVQVVVLGQASPTERGLQMSVRTSLSTRRGLLLERAFAVILHLPALLPFLVSLTVRLPSAPQVGAAPEVTGATAEAPHLPFTVTFLSSVAVQLPSAWSAQTLSLNVHDPFAELTPSASQFGSQSVHWMTPPFLS